MSAIRLVYECRDYDRRVTGTSDVEFWVEECRAAGGPVLELGCGTGRVTIPVAAAGVDVTGLDNSDSMLKRARRKSVADEVEVSWMEGDMRTFDLGRRFALIYVPLASFAHLSGPGDAEACLARVRRHLPPGGRFAVDLMNPDFNGALAPYRVERPATGPDIVTGGPGLKSHTLDEIERLFTGSGFQIIDTFGYYDRSPVRPHSPRLLITAERK